MKTLRVRDLKAKDKFRLSNGRAFTFVMQDGDRYVAFDVRGFAVFTGDEEVVRISSVVS